MANESKYYTIGALGKAFAVIELMAHKAKWELGELCKMCGLPKGTLQRTLLTLDELGYVRQEFKGGAYGLTMNSFKLGRRIVSNNSFVEQARPARRNLLETLNETVNLCIASGTDMVVVDQQASRRMLRLNSIIGSSSAIRRSASGKAFTAFLPRSLCSRSATSAATSPPRILKRRTRSWPSTMRKSTPRSVAWPPRFSITAAASSPPWAVPCPRCASRRNCPNC